jgi:UDP-N-acetylmuramate dehydrogenase
VIKKFNQIAKNLRSKFFFDYDISSITWFRTGGRADLFCIVADESELEIILNHIDNDVPIFVIGAGSNVLVRDGGFRGIIIKLGKSFNNLNIYNNLIYTGASILDANLSKFAYLKSIKDLEFFIGIPGSIGGAVKMNSGCYGSETKDVLKEILIIKKNGSKKILKNKDLDFKYRKSNLSDHDIVTSAVFKANFGEKEEIELKMSEIKFFRKNSQPIETKTGGSTFKNPKKQFAAKLIDNSDCKGLIYGDAIVSNKHSNFLVNLGNATAKDIETLGRIVQDRVLKKFNISLEWEIKIIGESSE